MGLGPWGDAQSPGMAALPQLRCFLLAPRGALTFLPRRAARAQEPSQSATRLSQRLGGPSPVVALLASASALDQEGPPAPAHALL